MPNNKAIGCLIVAIVVMGPISVLLLYLGIAGFAGSARPIAFSCDRASGSCVLRARSDRTLALAELRDAEVLKEHAHIGKNTYEDQWRLVAHMQSGPDVELADPSGDETSAAEYRQAAKAIHDFLAGTDATLTTQVAVREGSTSSWNNVVLGVFGLAFFVLLPAFMLVRLRKRR